MNKKVVLLLVAVVLLVGFGFFWRWKIKAPESANNAVSADALQVENTGPKPSTVAERFPDDKDRDGVSDAKERELGTSEAAFDSDNDGLADYDELEIWKTDPNKADTDGDGYKDGLEVVSGFNPLGQGKIE